MMAGLPLQDLIRRANRVLRGARRDGGPAARERRGVGVGRARRGRRLAGLRTARHRQAEQQTAEHGACVGAEDHGSHYLDGAEAKKREGDTLIRPNRMDVAAGLALRAALLVYCVAAPGWAVLRGAGFSSQSWMDYVLAGAAAGAAVTTSTVTLLLLAGLYTRPILVILLLVPPLYLAWARFTTAGRAMGDQEFLLKA